MGAQGSGERLAQNALLRMLPQERLRPLAQQCVWRHVDAHEQILDRDSESRDVFLVIGGKVEVVNYALSGREVAFAQISAGGYFGELAAIDGRARSASVVALEPGLLAVMPAEVFLTLLNTYPELALKVLRRLAYIIRSADERIMDLSTLKAVQRVYAELLKLARQEGERWEIRPMLTQREIARRASTSRETVARVLSQLMSGAIIARKGSTVLIQDMERLSLLAEIVDSDQEGR
jgi:CRP-like cAMP-binding protein